ncbi:flagellar hook capping FlgD N-terminal domain-containing protein [Castellaniella defragrans]|uniref:Basal-body rod modification protein FlgD n=2 Tax=Castellaniella defragrans TaxID=75697 RepID=W8X527_CASD6|nr:flagellar hook capping FlgD N-terminal domain-containing protein [Castellaniella defragrans]KAB0609774.1 flagellar basal body rod modification protein [Castellaniella defragrans]MBB6082403.1 flagellar basal-body rod modification protein FlgD [Castellaniella defragrans]CDM24826.1 Flagellar basal-body rod modification protein FlgD [Castellaniella defragrans 65Phen]
MTTVNDVYGTSTASTLANAQSSSLLGDTQDRFLTLLVTQLQNQDPLNPMDNAEVTTQIAQLSMVNGIQSLNNTLLALSGQMDMSQSLQAAGLIGKDILYPGEKISLGSDPDTGAKIATPFGIDLMSGAAKTTVSILDATGKAVRIYEFGAQDAGIYPLSWDGLDAAGVAVPDGAYTVQVAASDANGQPVSAEALTSGHIGSVAYTAEGLRLNLALGEKISLLDVRQVM